MPRIKQTRIRNLEDLEAGDDSDYQLEVSSSAFKEGDDVFEKDSSAQDNVSDEEEDINIDLSA